MISDLVSLTYRSRLRLADPAAGILRILQASRVRNPRLGITGILLYNGFHFVQTIEGPRATCNELFAQISKDPRHSQIIDRLGHLGVLRQERAFAPQPAFQILDQWGSPCLARLEPDGGVLAVQVALDCEQRVDALHGLEGDGRDLFGILALANVPLDVGQLEELAARMGSVAQTG